MRKKSLIKNIMILLILLMNILVIYSTELQTLPDQPTQKFLIMSNSEKWGVVLFYFSALKKEVENYEELSQKYDEQGKQLERIMKELEEIVQGNIETIQETKKEMKKSRLVHHVFNFSFVAGFMNNQEITPVGGLDVQYSYLFNRFLFLQPLLNFGVTFNIISGQAVINQYNFPGAQFRIGTGIAF